MIEIKYINPIWSRCELKDLPAVREVLQYDSPYYRPRHGGRGRERHDYVKHAVDKSGTFLSGFIPRLNEALGVEISGGVLTLFLSKEELIKKVEHFKLRDYQMEAYLKACHQVRGVIHYPTGSGKTHIFCAILYAWIRSSLKNEKALILVNTQDLLYQNQERAVQFFGKINVGLIGDGIMDPRKITVATVQSLKDLDLERLGDITAVIVDEAHFCSSFDGTYNKVLTQILAPIRLGFTATIPTKPEALMAMEGLLGPIVAEKKQVEIPDLAKVVISLKKLPFRSDINRLTRYKSKTEGRHVEMGAYDLGVVYNRSRNLTILEDAQKFVEDGRTVLIFVTMIEHGNNLMLLANKRFPDMKVEFVQGLTPAYTRLLTKRDLNSKIIPVVISTTVWKTGVDIPSLGAIINAAGGKSEIQTIQLIGRGVRKPPGKENVIIRDYFDASSRFFVEHFGHRISTYFDEKWLGEEK